MKKVKYSEFQFKHLLLNLNLFGSRIPYIYTCKCHFIKGLNLSNDLTQCFAHRLVELKRKKRKRKLVAKVVHSKIKNEEPNHFKKGQSTQENNII